MTGKNKDFSGGTVVKSNAGNTRDMDSISVGKIS